MVHGVQRWTHCICSMPEDWQQKGRNLVDCVKKKPPPSNPEFPQNQERCAVGGDYESSKRGHQKVCPSHSSPQRGSRTRSTPRVHSSPTAPQSKLCLTCFKKSHPDAACCKNLARSSAASDCILQTWPDRSNNPCKAPLNCPKMSERVRRSETPFS